MPDIDNNSQSLLAFIGNENVHGLYDFLLNHRSFLSSVASVDVPLLYSPVPFQNAPLHLPEWAEDVCKPSIRAAVAVVAELVDFALGIDTDGGVRIPAAFCGILGLCPSHGVVSTVGVVPMTQSFDTVDWFARDPNILRHVGHVLLQLPLSDFRQRRCILVADDYF